MNFSKLPVFVIFTLLIYSCNNQQQKEKIYDDNAKTTSGIKDSSYSKIEIYCWGFSSDSLITVNHCTPTGGRTSPSEFINDKILIDSIVNKNTINLLKNMIFGNKKDLGAAKYGCDTRFLMLFKKNDLNADTIVYGGTDVLCFNDKLLFNYTFEIMDSIRYFLNKEEISCDCESKILKGL